MVNEHPTDEEIQEYALDASHCEKRIPEHVHRCNECKAKAAAYEMLFTGIRQQPAPVLNFDLREAVLSQITPRKSKPLPESLLVVLLTLAGLLFAGCIIYVCSRHLPGFIEGLAPVVMYLIITIGMAILTVLVIDAYRSYQNKIDLLDFN